METTELEKLKYPTGKYIAPEKIKKSEVKRWIKEIDKLPKRLKDTVKNLSEEQLDTPYRDGGWTVRQVIHHLADSHMNSFIRFRLALTEDNPTIKPYEQSKWAELQDSKTAPVKYSLDLLRNLHKRWVMMLKTIDKEQLKRSVHHPEHNADWKLDWMIGMYAWHCNHHLAHIENLKTKMNWK
ncbi:MAG TPA: bacillithiol transferase BstA [Bacteroidia bacterium]|nr:bacillithiol transferase BstA [Bacteroidia bacterium]